MTTTRSDATGSEPQLADSRRHVLDPLRGDEIRSLATLLRSDDRFLPDMRFVSASCAEPARPDGADAVRAAEVVLWHSATSLTVDSLLPERAREFAWEGWRRNDLIRFGQFENGWGFKAPGAAPATFQIFPVPNTELALNPKLVQNPNY